MSEFTITPWTEEQVQLLNEYQKDNTYHPYTCLQGHTLQATIDGWICPECKGFRQNWCHQFHFTKKETPHK